MSERGIVSIQETLIFVSVNLVFIIIGIILWYFLWIKKFGAELPRVYNETTINFSSRNLLLVIQELYRRILAFDPSFLTKSIGYEACVYLLFQRKIISVILTYFIMSIVISLIHSIIKLQQYTTESILTMVYQLFVDNQLFSKSTSPIIQLASIVLVTFIHFRCFFIIKKEAQYLYFTRFDKMSQKCDSDWLSCRTLHISGIAPNERNTSALQRKLNCFLSRTNSGRVIDITFIPNYADILQYEKQRDEINDLKALITQKNSCTKCCFSSIYWSNETVKAALIGIEKKLQECTERPVYSSGHAFISFDSLTAAHQVHSTYKDSPIKKLRVKMIAIWDSFRGKNPRMSSENNKKATFQQFKDEINDEAIMDNDEANDYEGGANVNILVDQLIEPCDIIWDNVGGDRGLYICRRIILNIIMILLLLFFTTPASLFSTIKSIDYFSVLEFNWIVKIPYGYLFITYIPPLIILLINLGLITLIDMVARFEKHYTHSNYHYSFFGKSLIYMLFNFLIIPSLALTAPLYSIITSNLNEIIHLLSQIYVSNSGYFFITLIIQNGTISSIFYLLRTDELIFNSFSPQIVFYKRHFINTGHVWHRKEADCFLFGYFYAQLLVFYTITLVFSSTMPILSLVALYYFIFRHFSDFASFLMVHGQEIDSNGKLINHILNFSFISVILFHLAMLSLYVVREQYYAVIAVAMIMAMSIGYVIYFNSSYLIDIYSLHEQLEHYEHPMEVMPVNEVNKWRNKFKHPLVIPVFVDQERTPIKDRFTFGHYNQNSNKDKNKDKDEICNQNSNRNLNDNIVFEEEGGNNHERIDHWNKDESNKGMIDYPPFK